MKHVIAILALMTLAGCQQKSSAPPPPPAPEEKDSIELKLDTKEGAVEFKKEDGEGDDVDIEVKTE